MNSLTEIDVVEDVHESSRIARTGEESSGAEVVALAPPPPAEIKTRKRLPRTKLAEGLIKVDVQAEPDLRPSLVTRRQAWLRRRRRKRLLTGIALVFALFPPVWAVYLIGWLVWRSRAPQRSMRRVKKGVRALEKNRTGVALQRLQEGHLLDPSNSDALYWMGLLLGRQQRQEEAREALSLVAERVPGLPEVEAALVDACVATGEAEAAVHHAQRLLDVAPYAPETLLKLADAFEAAGRPEMAAQALRQAPLHKPLLTDPLVQIHYRLGALHEQQDELAQALHHFKRVYAQDITYRDVRARVEAVEAALAR